MLFFTIACLAHLCAGFENDTDFFNTTANITVARNSSVEMERIVQPSQLFEQTQSLTIPPTNLSINSRSQDSKPIKDFRPSPQLETYYEYNKFPVVPAFPEAKRFSSSVVGEGPNRPWVGKVLSERTTETALPWVSRVRFPAATSKDYPYPFVTNVPASSTESPIQYGPPHPDYPVQKIPDTVNPALFTFPNYGDPSRYGALEYGSIDKFERGPVSVRRPVLETPHFGLEGRPGGDVMGSTWKKIVKFLTAAIPIGILISALTPSVINVSSVNVTQKNRARSRENESRTNGHLTTSLNFIEGLRSKGCEERILCELLISASSSGDAENLLEVFTRQEKNARKKRGELKRITESVRKNNCDEFVCRLQSRKNRK